jgi:RHS repeat-associated protein
VQYLYEGAQALGEIRNGQLTHRLLTGLNLDETIARIALNANGQKDAANSRIYLTDALNSVIAQLSDDTANPGQMQNSYAYSPYGEAITVGPDAKNNPNQYTSRENDGTGLYFYRARYYDPVLKQFLSDDPIGLDAGLNVRGYVEGDPVMLNDPTGEIAPLVAMAAGALFGGGLDLAIQLYRNGGRLECVDWADVGIAALSSMSIGGRLGYKATLEGMKGAAKQMTKEGAYNARAQVKRDYRLFGRVDDWLRKRDKPFSQVKDPIESFARSNAAYDLAITGPAAANLGARLGKSATEPCPCK